MFQVKSTRTAIHIDGMDPATTGGGVDTGKGYVSYSAYSACPALTRNGSRMQALKSDKFATVADALARCEVLVRAYGVKLCSFCEKRARQLVDEAAAADVTTDAAAALSALLAEWSDTHASLGHAELAAIIETVAAREAENHRDYL